MDGRPLTNICQTNSHLTLMTRRGKSITRSVVVSGLTRKEEVPPLHSAWLLCRDSRLRIWFDLHEYELEVEKHFHMSGFARRRFFKKRQEATRKWPITQGCCSKMNLMFKYDGPVNNCKRVSIFTSLFFYN